MPVATSDQPAASTAESLRTRIAIHTATLDRTITFTRHADTKAAPVIALGAGLAAATVTQSGLLRTVLTGDPSATMVAAWVLLIAYMVPAVSSLLLGLRIFVPVSPRTGKSLVYFEDIRIMPREQFIEAGKNDADEALLVDILTQVHTVSDRASEKFRWLRTAFLLAMASLAAWLALAVTIRL